MITADINPTNAETVGPSGEPDEQILHLGQVVTYLLTGVPYLYGRQSYGNEMVLHFGTNRGYGSPKMAGKSRGTHVLSLRGSAWMLKSGSRPAYVGFPVVPSGPSLSDPRKLDGAALESGAFVTPGARVVHAGPFWTEVPAAGYGLEVVMTDGTMLLVAPTPPPDENPENLPEIADWEILTPHGFLEVGPGRAWTFSPTKS